MRTSSSARWHVATLVRNLVQAHVDDGKAPTILEIPSKEHPYEASKDPIMQTVLHLMGAE